MPTRHRPDTPSSELLAQWTARFKNNEAFARRWALLEERANTHDSALKEVQQRLESLSPSELARRLGDPAQEDAVAPACAPSETEVREVLEQPPPSSTREIASVVVQRLSACASYVSSEDLIRTDETPPLGTVLDLRGLASHVVASAVRRSQLLERISVTERPDSPGCGEEEVEVPSPPGDEGPRDDQDPSRADAKPGPDEEAGCGVRGIASHLVCQAIRRSVISAGTPRSSGSASNKKASICLELPRASATEEPLVIAPAAKPRVSVPEIALAGIGRPSLSALKSQSLRRPTLLRVSFSTLPVSSGYVLEQQSSKDRSQSDPCPESSVRDLAAAVVRRATLGSILGLDLRCAPEAASGPLDLPKVSTPRWSLTDQLIAQDSFGPYVHPSPPADCKTLGRISDARGLASYLIRQSIRMSVSRADAPLSAAEVSTPTSSGRSDVL